MLPTPSSPHTRNARSATTMAYLRLDPWPLAMAPQPIRLGSWPLPAPSFGGQPSDSRPLASGSPWLVLDRRPLERLSNNERSRCTHSDERLHSAEQVLGRCPTV